MTKKETFKWIVQIIASIATAILTAMGTVSCCDGDTDSDGNRILYRVLNKKSRLKGTFRRDLLFWLL